MDVRQTMFPAMLPPTRAAAVTFLKDSDRSRLSLPWLSTLIFAALASILILSSAFVDRMAARARLPRFVMIAKLLPADQPAALVARAARTQAAEDVAATEAAPGAVIAAEHVAPLPDVPLPSAAAANADGLRRIEISSVKMVDDQPVIRTNPFVHAKLSLLPSAPALPTLVSKASSRTVSLSALHRQPTSLAPARDPLYWPDLNGRSKPTAIGFPFANATFAPAVGWRSVRLTPRTVGPQEAEMAKMVEFGTDHAVDMARFGDAPAADVLGFAPIPNPRPAAQFASFDLGSASTPDPAAEGRTDDVLEVMSAKSFKTRTGDGLSADEAASPADEPFDDDKPDTEMESGAPEAAAMGGSDTVKPGDEAEDVFFPPAENGMVRTSIYDAVERAGRSNGLTPKLAAQLLKLLSTEYDFHESVGPNDRLDVFFSDGDGNDTATAMSELYFVRATFGGSYRTFYRFENEDGTIGYFGPEGRSAKQFLLRNPVPGGKFQSGFGMRRHPILGYDRMHNGVDWSAPKGTPIFATAGGTIERAGVNGGFGLQTIIRHGNGYTTSYAHQSALADGVTEGASVRQGDVIGFVGSTGLATGAHIHYEVSHDGVDIDPMQVAASDGPMLRGDRLDAFLAERDRIDGLLYTRDDAVLSLAAAGP